MAVRRKSNWYIYIIAFIIAMAFALMAIFTFRWYLFPSETTSVGLNETGELNDDFKPSSQYNFSVLMMISDDEADSPQLFVLTEYSSVDNRVSFIPIPNGISVAAESRDLSNVYTAHGGEGVLDALNGILGTDCSAYVKIGRLGFIDFVTNFGNVEYDVAKTLVIRDGSFIDTVNAGKQRLSAETIFRLIMVADYEDGEAYRFNVIGGLLSDLVNQNFRSFDSSLMDTLFRNLSEVSENNITEQIYKSHKAAMLYTIEYGSYPAEYYVPYGEYTSDGGFNISDNSITSIRQKSE